MNAIKNAPQALHQAQKALSEQEEKWKKAQSEYHANPSVNAHDEEVRQRRLKILAENVRWARENLKKKEKEIAAMKQALKNRHLTLG